MTLPPDAERPCGCDADPHMIEFPRLYDGGLIWACPICGEAWHRWPTGHPRRELAERVVHGGGYQVTEFDQR